MSKIRFTRTIRGTLHVQVPVQTERGMRTAATQILLVDPELGFSAAEARTAVQVLLNGIDRVRANASKRKVEEEPQ